MPLCLVPRLDAKFGAALGARFREVGLTRETVHRLTGPDDDLRSPLTPTRTALFSDDPTAVTLRLFFCREIVARAEAGEALGQDMLEQAIDARVLLASGAESVVAPFHLRLAGGLYLFSDYLGHDGDAVMGAGETTAILFRAARPCVQVGRVLDLGCGAGTLALLLAGHCDESVGADINPRAVALAQWNASVNGIANVEFRCGDMWDPVEGERFDLIVSQPPYYPRAAARGDAGDQVFLHGGERGDELPRRVVAGVARHLTPAGRALVFTSWPDAFGCPVPDGFNLLELRTDRRELHGTRQVIDVLQPSAGNPGAATSFEVAPECWGNLESRHIESIQRSHALLDAPAEGFLNATLRFPDGMTTLREGARVILCGGTGSLTGTVAVDETTWSVLSAVNQAPTVREASSDLRLVGDALRRGLLVVPEPIPS